VTRRLVGAFACRAGGSRLYGKPLQNLDRGVTILDAILQGAQAGSELHDVVLGIAEGVENLHFIDFAHKYKVGYILGDEKDVLWRLIQCARAGRATDVFRITTECPFIPWEFLGEAWRRHCEEDNDFTVIDHLPTGVGFEIFRAEVLELSHAKGNERERSELCSLYMLNHLADFRVGLIEPPPALKRPDLRLTVDYAEDLILCQAVYRALKHLAPRIPVADIIAYIDAHPEKHRPVEQFHEPGPHWAPVLARLGS
jgi:spore coat polysaccharide biosynthesis protein SpsF